MVDFLSRPEPEPEPEGPSTDELNLRLAELEAKISTEREQHRSELKQIEVEKTFSDLRTVEREAEITKLQQNVASLELRLQESEKQVAERDKEIAQSEQQLDNEILGRDQYWEDELEKKDTELSELSRKLKHAYKQLRHVDQPRSSISPLQSPKPRPMEATRYLGNSTQQREEGHSGYQRSATPVDMKSGQGHKWL